MFYPVINPATITQQGKNRCDFMLTACQAYDVRPRLELRGNAQGTFLENTGQGMDVNELPERALGKAAEALDDLRRLGTADLTLNF